MLSVWDVEELTPPSQQDFTPPLKFNKTKVSKEQQGKINSNIINTAASSKNGCSEELLVDDNVPSNSNTPNRSSHDDR